MAQAKPGDVLGITMMERLKSPTDLSGELFYLCTHPKAVVFKVPQPGIYYLGELEYSFRANGRVLEMQQGQQIQAASEHLKRFYPNLQGELQPLASDLRSGTGEACVKHPQRIEIPIYIHIR